jgi:MATE family multidrug resistance protein
MVILLLPMWGVGLAGGYWLAFGDLAGPPLGARGFWIAETAGMAMAALGMWIYFLRIANSPLKL